MPRTSETEERRCLGVPSGAEVVVSAAAVEGGRERQAVSKSVCLSSSGAFLSAWDRRRGEPACLPEGEKRLKKRVCPTAGQSSQVFLSPSHAMLHAWKNRGTLHKRSRCGGEACCVFSWAVSSHSPSFLPLREEEP